MKHLQEPKPVDRNVEHLHLWPEFVPDPIRRVQNLQKGVEGRRSSLLVSLPPSPAPSRWPPRRTSSARSSSIHVKLSLFVHFVRFRTRLSSQIRQSPCRI
jgi:hypothetical protein